METEYWWNEKTESLTRRQYRYSYSHHFNEGGGEEEGKRAHKNIPAPLATEILERLPYSLDGKNRDGYYLTIDKAREYYHVGYEDIRGNIYTQETAPTLAQAVTDMLIHLIKEELI